MNVEAFASETIAACELDGVEQIYLRVRRNGRVLARSDLMDIDHDAICEAVEAFDVTGSVEVIPHRGTKRIGPSYQLGAPIEPPSQPDSERDGALAMFGAAARVIERSNQLLADSLRDTVAANTRLYERAIAAAYHRGVSDGRDLEAESAALMTVQAEEIAAKIASWKAAGATVDMIRGMIQDAFGSPSALLTSSGDGPTDGA